MVLLAHARGDICIRNYNPCNDVLELEAALKVFGFQVSKSEEEITFRFSEQTHRQSSHHYRFEASATAFRLWISVLANLPGIRSQVYASEILVKRGIEPLCQSLRMMGAKCSLEANCLQITGANLSGGRIHTQMHLSSQYASSLVLAAPFMQNPLSLDLNSGIVSATYLNLSLQMLRSFGVNVHIQDSQIEVQRANFTLPQSFEVDSDLSTVAFMAVRAALGQTIVETSSRRVYTELPLYETSSRRLYTELPLYLNPGLDQPDMKIWSILQGMGVKIETTGTTYRIYPSDLQGIELDLTDNPDLMPVLSIAALFAKDPMHLTGIGRLVHKESNRISGICQALEKLGAKYRLDQESLYIWPLKTTPPACTLDTQRDHRLVMAFSLLLPRFPQVQLSEWASLDKSLPSSSLGLLIVNCTS